MQIGDRVQFVNESLEGVITRIIDKNTVGVSVEEGFEIPVLKKELIPAGNPPIKNQERINESRDNADVQTNHTEPYLRFERVTDTLIRMWFVNPSQTDLLISVSVKKPENYFGLFAGLAETKSRVMIHTLDFPPANHQGSYHFRIIPHEAETVQLSAPYSIAYKIRSNDLDFMQSGNRKGFQDVLLKHDKNDSQYKYTEPALSEPFSIKEEIRMDRPEETVDLHIHKLISHYQNMAPGEALTLQLNVFRNAFEKAIALHYGKITFIHGVGANVLKKEIWKAVSGHPSVKTYYESRKDKFGYGATDIVLV